MVSREDIRGAFGPWLDRIEETPLAERTVDVWLKGCARGGWTDWAAVEAVPFTLLTDARGIGLVAHTVAVTAGAWGLAKAQEEAYGEMPYPVHWDRLLVGGLLHDVGKLLEIAPDGRGGYCKSHVGRCARHPISGAFLAHEVGLPEEILNCIACHAKEGDGRPQTLETILIHQADFATFDPLVMMKKGDLILEPK